MLNRVHRKPSTFYPPASDATSPPRTARITVDAQGLALVILATIAVVFALEWAQSFFIPLLLGILLAYTLNPLVAWLERIKIRRVAGASLVIVAVVGALGFGTYSLRGQMQTIIEQLPEAASKLAAGLTKLGRASSMRCRKYKPPQASSNRRPAKRPVFRHAQKTRDARRHRRSLRLQNRQRPLGGFRGAVGYMVQATMVLFLIFFFLLSGDTYKRKLVRLTGRRSRARRSRCKFSMISTTPSSATCSCC